MSNVAKQPEGRFGKSWFGHSHTDTKRELEALERPDDTDRTETDAFI
jgi:hypothetical protein